jgi:hypothetical protein
MIGLFTEHQSDRPVGYREMGPLPLHWQVFLSLCVLAARNSGLLNS